jgi:RimJ/RimL family protein N-acetyltransferase
MPLTCMKPTPCRQVNWVSLMAAKSDPYFYAVRLLTTGRVVGVASYLRIDPGAGSIEVGHINFSPALQRTPASTEVMYLLMDWAFAAGYRRYEWKCNALNIPSRRAAERLGLSYEGIFRQAGVVKGRNRDTAWFATIDAEWPALKAAFTRWLEPDNFGPDGVQKVSLASLTAPVLVARDPVLT